MSYIYLAAYGIFNLNPTKMFNNKPINPPINYSITYIKTLFSCAKPCMHESIRSIYLKKYL